jgi:hypothetical protein
MKKIAVFILSFFILSCSSLDVKNYSAEKPTLKLEEYMNGTFDAYGVFLARNGEVKKRFHVLIIATWKDKVGVLDESFTYSDGTTSKRIWTVTKTSDNTYIGTASDVVGEAKGEIAGNALRWKYILALDVDGSTYHVDFDDWMFLMDDKVMLNKSVMSKWGFYLGEVVLSFKKR